jgi:hypothetical protein
MNNPDTDFFFPLRAIPALDELRSEEWQSLIARILEYGDEDLEKIAFSSLMIKLAGCVGCSADSFRALRGCTQCSKLVIKRYKGSDKDLVQMYQISLDETERILRKRAQLTFEVKKEAA